jgi:hypothetical protein
MLETIDPHAAEAPYLKRFYAEAYGNDTAKPSRRPLTLEK